MFSSLTRNNLLIYLTPGASNGIWILNTLNMLLIILNPVTGSRAIKWLILLRPSTEKNLNSAYLLNNSLYYSKSVGSNFGFLRSDFNFFILSTSSFRIYSSFSKAYRKFGNIWFNFFAASSLFSLIALNFCVLASSDMNYDGIELGKITKNGGKSISRPGIIMKIEKGMNLITSYFTWRTFTFSKYSSLWYL